MAAQLVQFLPCSDVPEADDLALASRGQRLAVRRKGDAVAVPPTEETGKERPCMDLPHVDPEVSSSGQGFAIRRKSDGMHHPKIGFELLEFVTAGNVPKPDHLSIPG